MASMRDVARHAGVSSATVSRVLRNKPNVSASMRQRVLTAVDELGYRPNRVARSLRVRQANIIGLVVSQIENFFFTTIARAVEDVAFEREHALFLANTDENLEREQIYLDLMEGEHVAGVIIAPACDADTEVAQLLAKNVPVVAIDRRLPKYEVDTVLTDNLASSYKLVIHLLEHGHRRIGAIVGTPAITTGWERLTGYQRALQQYDIAADPDLICSVLPHEKEGYEAMRRLWHHQPQPTAVFTGTEVLAAGALRAIQELNLTIPDDIAFVTFDDPFWSTLVRPPITCIRQPVYDVGRLAAELLFQRLAEPHRPTHDIVLKSALIVRQSCGCMNKSMTKEFNNNG